VLILVEIMLYACTGHIDLAQLTTGNHVSLKVIFDEDLNALFLLASEPKQKT
jgi:hypothetical protein